MEIMEAIKTRRSVRKYKDIPVSDKVLNEILEAARLAPSWANTQCWRFIVVRDTAVKAALAEMIGKNPSTEAIKTAPIVIVACAELGKSGFYKGVAVSDLGDWFMYDVAIAMEHIALAAHALGLGTVHVGLNFDSKKTANILGIPPGFRAVVMTPLGYPEGESRIIPRKELSEIVFYDRWQA